MVYSAQPPLGAYEAPCARPYFEIHARACPQVLARVTGLLARFDMMPADFRARRSCGGLWMRASFEAGGADHDRIAERLRAIIGVEAVLLFVPPPSPRATPLAPPDRSAAIRQGERIAALADMLVEA